MFSVPLCFRLFATKRPGVRGIFAVLLGLILAGHCHAENWPRWRGPGGNAVSNESRLPIEWDRKKSVQWKTVIPGEGSSSPIVWADRVFVTSALEFGLRRQLHCLDRQTGDIQWTCEIADADPELSSALTGYAAPTPVTDGQRVVAFLGNGGLICCDLQGDLQWHRSLGQFESELGLASSPILHDGLVIQLCDHDGSSFRSFDSYLIAIALDTGAVRWKTPRPKLFRSWSTPIVTSLANGRHDLIVNAQDELRGYDPHSGQLLWRILGMTGWVTPSPVFGDGLIYATSGKNGPTMAIRPGGRGDVTGTHIAWKKNRGAPYVCSPLLFGGELYVHNEQGIVNCFCARTGTLLYQERLAGKFTASAVAGDGHVWLTNDQGTTYVLKAGRSFRLVAENRLDAQCLASPAISQGCVFLRTDEHLYCIGS